MRPKIHLDISTLTVLVTLFTASKMAFKFQLALVSTEITAMMMIPTKV
jgi:hypothetical protein